MPAKIRLDQYLVELGHYATRSRARDAILRGSVRVNGKLARKPAAAVSPDIEIAISDAAHSYVSRAALKLKQGLDATGYAPAGRLALDIGASTGGFTQVLLEAGAAHVCAIDAGHGQMDPKLAADSRVTSMEGINAREIDAGLFGGAQFTFLVADVSFISLKLALPPALGLAATGAVGIFLIKPQFEVGREHVGKSGLVREKATAEKSAQELAGWFDQQPGWRLTHFLPSPIKGGDGNREWLMAGKKNR